MTPHGQPPKIAIIGAGPTGCMLARLLLHLPSSTTPPPTVHVFESESSPNYRSQGGTLDLHPQTGLAALQAAGLFEQFLEKARYDGDALQITDKDLNVFIKVAPSTKPSADDDVVTAGGSDLGKRLVGARPEIDRGELRRILIESLPGGTIQWGMRVNGVYDEGEGLASAKKTIHFANSPPLTGYDLVVGADGAWSKVRPYLSSQKPVFAKVGLFDLSIPDAETVAPRVYEAINGGNLFAYGTGKFVAVQMMGDGSVNVYVQSVMGGEDWMDTCSWYFPEDPDRTRRELVEGPFAEWHAVLKESIVKGTARCVPRTLYQLPVGFRWEHRRGVTLIGDAAHLMTPYAGEGVNVGLMDALVLGRGVVEGMERGEGGLDGVVRGYEEEMWPRAEEVAGLTDRLKELWMFTEGAPGSVIARAAALHAQKHVPWVLRPVVKVVVHLYYWGMRMVWGY